MSDDKLKDRVKQLEKQVKKLEDELEALKTLVYNHEAQISSIQK